MTPLGALSLGIAVVLVVILVGFYLWVLRRNRALGAPGVVSRSRLTCSKCHRTFDYDYIPGASLTAVRLGGARYMACPLCHRWSTFDLTSDRRPAVPPGGS